MQVTIGATTYEVYADIPTADAYLEGQITADTWRASDETTKARALVSATRLIDRQVWQGEKTDSYQESAFPRTGLTDADGVEVDSTTVPQQVVDATCELASAMVDGSNVQDSSQPGENTTQSLRAGSVAISYFRSIQGLGQRFPQIIWELLGLWLAGSQGGTLGCVSHGTGGKDQFKRGYDFNRGF